MLKEIELNSPPPINTNDKERIKSIKKHLIQISTKARVGHIPSSLSCIEILYVLYNKIANITKGNASNLTRDRIIISKEHARLGQMAVLTENGLLDNNLFEKFMRDENAPLGHDLYGFVCPNIPQVDIACGSLGHGLPVGVGLALGDCSKNIYVLVGDGELQEGTNWESIIFAGYRKIKNLTLIVDRNNQQIDGKVQDIVDTYTNIPKQIEAFGFDVIECDGHNIEELEAVFKKQTDNPKCIIANTIKGKDCRFALDEMGYGLFHAAPLSDENVLRAYQEIDRL